MRGDTALWTPGVTKGLQYDERSRSKASRSPWKLGHPRQALYLLDHGVIVFAIVIVFMNVHTVNIVVSERRAETYRHN